MACSEFDELYGMLRDAPAAPVTVAHLGQSLDGFIATRSGDSRFVTGQANLVHLHRMRSLCDAVIVGAATIAFDDPQLTTRLVPGPSPLRVVIDPLWSLGDHYRVFSDGAARTVLACSARRLEREDPGRAGPAGPRAMAARSSSACRTRAWAWTSRRSSPRCGRGAAPRVFIEGGGQTVSSFLAAGLVDRLQITVAPFLIGDGRPAIRLPAPALLGDCARPTRRVYRMGDDILFDFDLGRPPAGDRRDPGATGAAGPQAESLVVRVL